MRQNTAHWLTAALVIGLYVVAGQSQEGSSRDLVLTGSVVGVKVVPVFSTSQKDEDAFEVELYLQFKNNTDGPLIIFKPSQLDAFTSIYFQTDLSPSSLGSASSRAIPEYPHSSKRYVRYFVKGYDPVERFILSYGSNPYLFVVVPPKGYFECNDKVILADGYEVESRIAGKSKMKVAIPKYPALRVRYLISSSGRKDLANLLLSAKESWAETGTLYLDSSGSYDLASEMILNKLTE
jgi:hypothetical protein